jgi:putative membrane protein
MARRLLIFAAAAALALSSAVAMAQNKPSQASQKFLKEAIEGNHAEIQMGQLAQRNGQSDAVKSFGQMLTTDHSNANQKALDAAKAVGMNPAAGPNAKQKADFDKMSKMTGAAFDKAFLQHMAKDHKKEIQKYQKQSKMQDAAGQYAGGEVPTLQKHLDTAQSAARSARAQKQ